MQKTKISYLTDTWNPIAMRCTRISPACDNCWHLRMANRLAANPQISTEARAAYAGETGPVLIESRLDEPMKRRKPAVIGVQYMGDIFHESVPNNFIYEAWRMMVLAKQHTFLILTKRPTRMQNWVTQFYGNGHISSIWPHIWLGVTIENQAAADERIPLLLQTPAAMRWISAEPLLEKIDINKSCAISGMQWGCGGKHSHGGLPAHHHHDDRCAHPLDLVITAGETGPGARPSHPDHFRLLRDQCQATGVKFHFKQHGEWQGVDQSTEPVKPGTPEHIFDDGTISFKVGNKRAGHKLDGVEWREMPEVKGQ